MEKEGVGTKSVEVTVRFGAHVGKVNGFGERWQHG